MSNEKPDIKKTLELIAAQSAVVEKDAKKGGPVHRLAVAVNLLTAIVDLQEDRLQKLEKESALPYGSTR